MKNIIFLALFFLSISSFSQYLDVAELQVSQIGFSPQGTKEDCKCNALGGTYIFDVFNVENFSGLQIYKEMKFIKIDSIVDVSGSLGFFNSNLTGFYSFEISLPFQSNFTSLTDINGLVSFNSNSTSTTFSSGEIQANSVTDRALIVGRFDFTGVQKINFNFKYIVK